jgi:hypothetical protein
VTPITDARIEIFLADSEILGWLRVSLESALFYLTLCITASGIFDNFCVTGHTVSELVVSRHEFNVLSKY